MQPLLYSTVQVSHIQYLNQGRSLHKVSRLQVVRMVNIQMPNLMGVYSINYLQYIPHCNACIAGNCSLIIAFGPSTTGQLVDTHDGIYARGRFLEGCVYSCSIHIYGSAQGISVFWFNIKVAFCLGRGRLPAVF